MGVSGNSVAGKSFQVFTISEELLQKVVEAVQAGEKEARSSKNIQSFEVFCHGFRANISLGRIMIVPPAVCNDRENFPTALLYGAIVRVFGTAGEEVADLIEQRIGGGEFDEYSQLDFDTLKEKLFVDPRSGEEACLIVFAPNWLNVREYIAFHFTKDDNQLKNNLRHQVFSAYFDPHVSSAFNALMTNVNTTKVDVTDITPKLSYPAITENPLKEYPRLDKQAAYRKETILLNRKTADDVTKQTLDPQELDVFDALDTALSNSLGVDSGEGAQGEGGFTAPEDKPGVPREAAAKKADVNPVAPHATPFTNVGPGTEAAAEQKDMAPAVKESLDDSVKQNEEKATEPIGIAIDETGVPRRKEEESKAAAKKISHVDKNGICPGCKKAGKDCACSGCTCKAAANQNTRKRESSHPETLRVDPTRMSSAYSAAYNGGFVDRHAMPPQSIRGALAEVGDNSKPAPHAAHDHAKQIEAGAYGDDPLNRRANDKWGSAEVQPKRSNKEVMASYIADVVATEIDEPGNAMSHKARQARAKKESLLDKFRPKIAVELDIDSIWDAITEDMGPAPLVEVEETGTETNPAPSNTEDQGGWNENTSESDASAGGDARPRKKNLESLPEAFRSDEPEDAKEVSDSEAEKEETGFENGVTKEEEDHYHGASVDSKFADFVKEVANEIESEEELPVANTGAATYPNGNPVPSLNVGPKVVGGTPLSEQELKMEALLASIRPGDRVTILVPAGMGRDGQEWTERSGRAVIISPGRVALNMGGKHGTPGVATAENLVSVRKAKAGADFSGDAAEAKSETVSPGTVDTDIQQPTVSVEEAGKFSSEKNSADMSGDMSEVRSELEYNKAEIADEPEATDTVNPEHFASKGTCSDCGGKSNLDKTDLCSKCRSLKTADEQAVSVTPNQAKQIIKQELDKRGLPYTKLTAKTIGFSDLARGASIFVTIHGWQPNPAFDDLKKIAIANGFRVDARGSGFVGSQKKAYRVGKLAFSLETRINETNTTDYFKKIVEEVNVKFAEIKQQNPQGHMDSFEQQLPSIMMDIAQGMGLQMDYTPESDTYLFYDQSASGTKDKTYEQLVPAKQEGKAAAERHDDVPVAEGEAVDEKQPKSDLSGAAPEAHNAPAQVDSKEAAWGDDQPESIEFDFGAGDLADVVLIEETNGD